MAATLLSLSKEQKKKKTILRLQLGKLNERKRVACLKSFT